MDALIDDKYRKEQSYINGYKMFSKNYINGSPTVLFEAGMGDGSETWNDIQNKISLLTSTFSYDRAGIGKSDAALMSRTCIPSLGASTAKGVFRGTVQERRRYETLVRQAKIGIYLQGESSFDR